MAERVSVIATVLNEAKAIHRLLDSLAGQSRLPDELVIVDGGSSDGTLESLQAFAQRAPFPVRVVVRPGANISQGRNAAISEAEGPLIASTDAGVRLEAEWLERLTAPFSSQPSPDVVSGFFVPEYTGLFERILGAVTLPTLDEIDPERFSPSSRSVAFRKAAWARVGGYPEWLDYCEDLLFDFALQDAGFRFAFAPDARVHFRPRSTLKAYLKQYYRYARGDGKADFWRYRHALRYGVYLVGLPVSILATIRHPIGWLALVGVTLALTWMPVRRTLPHLRALPLVKSPVALGLAIVLRIAGDLAKMAGYPVGVHWRLRNAPAGVWPRRQW
ncbi:MAG: glycosyltransferase [Chloroflexi bacterium]|nr:glycosyltransferase [Chloroflexota bacterium]